MWFVEKRVDKQAKIHYTTGSYEKEIKSENFQTGANVGPVVKI